MSTTQRQYLLERLDRKKDLVLGISNNEIDELTQKAKEIERRTSQEMTDMEKKMEIKKLQLKKTVQKENANKAVDIIVAARETL